jgi:hypothetical protein
MRLFFVLSANMRAQEVQLPPELFGKVMLAVYSERKRLAACRRFAAASATCAAAAVALIPMANILYGEFLASGFGRFFMLVIYDAEGVAANWQEYGLSLLESFPALPAAGFLSVILIILLSVKSIAKYVRSIRRIRPAFTHT